MGTRGKPDTGKMKVGLANNDNFVGYLFIGIWIIGFLLFTAIPMVMSLYLSFTRYDALSAPEWVGFNNYIRMFTADRRYLKSLRVTVFYVIISVPLKLAFALIVAMLFRRQTRMSSLYRTMYYVPSVVGGSIAVAVMWRQIFGFDGALNKILMQIGLLSQPVAWLGNTKTAIWTLMVMAIWQFGSPMLIFLAGLKQIPNSYYEAAEVDGANGWKKFWRITFPSLSPVLFFNLVMQMISGFMSFTQAYVITEGMPQDSTLFYVLYLFQKSFSYFEMGYGSAMAWVLLAIVAALTALVFKFSDYWVVYENSKGGK